MMKTSIARKSPVSRIVGAVFSRAVSYLLTLVFLVAPVPSAHALQGGVAAAGEAVRSVIPAPNGTANQARRADNGASIGDVFDGEELVYTIGFWIFDDVAVGRMSLAKAENGEYVASLDAHTTGFVQKIITSRRDTYRSRLRVSDDGKRFITVSFEKTVTVGGKSRMSRTEMDYARRVMAWRTWGDDREEKTGKIKIPDGVYSDDPLAAFYNLRFGVYGPMEEGKEFKIHTIPKADKVPEIGVRVAAREELLERANGNIAADYLAYVTIDPDLFASAGTEIFFSSDLVPVEAVARDVALFGDVRGKLREVGYRMSARKVGFKGPDAP